MCAKRADKIELIKDEKRRLILQTASEIFAQKGYHQTVVKSITDSAGISVGTFYLYFKNKEDLFQKLYDEIWRYLKSLNDFALQGGGRSTVVQFSRVIASSIWGYQKFKNLTKIMMLEAVGLNPTFEEKYARFMRESVSEIEKILIPLQEQHVIDVQNSKVAATAYIGAVHNLITCWLRDDDHYDLCDSTFALVVFLLKALGLDFDAQVVQQAISEMNSELENNRELLNAFDS